MANLPAASRPACPAGRQQLLPIKNKMITDEMPATK